MASEEFTAAEKYTQISYSNFTLSLAVRPNHSCAIRSSQIGPATRPWYGPVSALSRPSSMACMAPLICCCTAYLTRPCSGCSTTCCTALYSCLLLLLSPATTRLFLSSSAHLFLNQNRPLSCLFNECVLTLASTSFLSFHFTLFPP
jgi:hypothetical protein